MKNKKGFLLAEEVIKIVVGVIAIGLLIYLLFSLYNLNKDSKDIEFAEESLNHLVEEINSERGEIQIYNPIGWVISSWFSSGEIPDLCLNNNWNSCICICDDLIRPLTAEVEECDIKGICVENHLGFSFEEPIEIKNPPINLMINYETKLISQK